MSLRLITCLEQRWNWITLGATTTFGSEGPCVWPHVTGSAHVLYGMWALCSGINIWDWRNRYENVSTIIWIYDDGEHLLTRWSGFYNVVAIDLSQWWNLQIVLLEVCYSVLPDCRQISDITGLCRCVSVNIFLAVGLCIISLVYRRRQRGCCTRRNVRRSLFVSFIPKKLI